jgi:HlyD family secretion protein
MTRNTSLSYSLFCNFGMIAVLFSIVTGCNRASEPSASLQGYVEGDFIYIAAPQAGRLETLFAQKGNPVKAGEPLFQLEDVQETAAQNETKQRIAQLRAQVADARKGKRPTEIESGTAQLNLARVALQYSENELARQEKLLAEKVVSRQDIDRLRNQRDQDRQRVRQLEADLNTSKLGLRGDQIAALEANVKALEAVLTRSEWERAQKRQNAPAGGLVFDTLYRPGELIAAGRPAVVLLPPQNIKVRVFVPQPLLATIHSGDRVKVSVDGVQAPFVGTVTFISPQAEYTPPVIYNRENRQKLVYLVELGFAPAVSVQLHPGQPVDIRFGSGI